uniref:Uncharacterized protein n=1 Tax=Solanum tuberosum TaxID=4113 RepID=M1BBU0_SOLTU
METSCQRGHMLDGSLSRVRKVKHCSTWTFSTSDTRRGDKINSFFHRFQPCFDPTGSFSTGS